MSQVCRLCLTYYENSSMLTKMTTDPLKNQIELILPEINLDIIKYPMICESCSKLLMSAYIFKNICIDNEVRIQTLLNNCLMSDVTLDELLTEGQTPPAPQEDPIEIVVIDEEQNESYNVGEGTTEYIILNQSQPTMTPKPVRSQKEITKKNGKERLVKCSFCERKFVGMKRLTWHKRLHPDRPYNCEICNWAFDDPSGLALHKKTHSAREVVIRDSVYHRCQICGVRTLCTGKFKMHVDEHLTEGHGVKRKYCESCNLQFVQDSDFESHMSQHKVNCMENLNSDEYNAEEILPT